MTFANGCFTDLLMVPIEAPDEATVLDLPADIEGFPGWQAVAR